MDANLINTNAGGGVRVATTKFVLTNNIIGANGSGVPGLRIDDAPAGSVFAFNTVSGNGGAGSGIAGGVQCNAAATLQASIVAGNSTTAAGTQFGGSCTLQSVVVATDAIADPGAIKLMPTFKGGGDFHLSSTADNSCCIDRIATPTTPNADHDVDRSKRPKGSGPTPFDIGAHELR